MTQPAPSSPPRTLPAREWLICFAVKEEAQCFKPEHADLRILITGMGRANAERAIKNAIDKKKPNLILTCGFAGGLDPSLARGAVLFAGDSESSLHTALVASGAKPAKFHCSDRIVVTAADKHALRQSTGADAVEMESAHICSLGRAEGIPSATIRVILDTANQDLPLNFNQLMTHDYRLNFSKLALQLVKSPRKIKSLLQLQKESRAAARTLGTVLNRLVSAQPDY